MKKLVNYLVIFFVGIAVWSCSYDDKDLWNAVEGLDNRVESLEQTIQDANTDIETLQQLVRALQQNVSITSVEQTANGYTIKFSDGTTADITNGSSAPAISVKKDTDGFYYWTLDGEFMMVDGQKIKAEGSSGSAPQLRIDAETKYWEISTDGGNTWTSMGVKAEGSDGDSMFTSVDTTSKAGFAVFTLKDGGTIEIPMQDGLNISLSASIGIFVYGEEQTFEVTSAGVENIVISKPDGWKVSLTDETLTVKAPEQTNPYADFEGTITLIGMAGKYSCAASLKVSAAETHVYTVTFEGAEWEPVVVANYAPGSYSTTSLRTDTEYTWKDNITQLTTGRPEGFMGGWGYPWFVDSYCSNSLDQGKYGNFLYDLYLYNPAGGEDDRAGGGNNGSDNFLVTYGYLDLDYPYGDGRPILEFADNQPRTIESLYLAPTCYFYSVVMDGNELSPALSADLIYHATGTSADGTEKTITMVYGTPTDGIPTGWVKWDLSELGAIVKLQLNQSGGADNGYGYSLPAYHAIDDITVRW